MIDRKARRDLARLLKQIAIGRITTGDYQELVEPLMTSQDHSVAQLARETEEIFYEVLSDNYISDNNRKYTPLRREIARWILFLHSDCESKKMNEPSPQKGLCLCLMHLVLTIMTGGLYLLAILIIFLAIQIIGMMIKSIKKLSGQVDSWPFQDLADYESALKMTILGPRWSNR